MKYEQQPNEDRLTFLVRIAIDVLREHSYTIDEIHYDDAVCDAYCLADDLESEL